MVRNEAKNIPLPRIAALFPDIFYGWVITGALALVMFSTVGVGFYSMGVFLDGLPTPTLGQRLVAISKNR